MKITVSAPGSIMLIGEHSVLQGNDAVLVGIEQRIELTLSSRSDGMINIQSAIGNYQTKIFSKSKGNKPFHFIVECLQVVSDIVLLNKKNITLSQGYDFLFSSQITPTVGFGSSAAAIVVTLSALLKINHIDYNNQQLWQFAKEVVLKIQGNGSGADVCASIYGGVVLFNAKTGFVKQLSNHFDKKLFGSLVYCGYKTPTAKVLQWVAEQFADKPKELAIIYDKMASITTGFFTAFERLDYDQIVQLMDAYQSQMSSLGVEDETIKKIIQTIKSQKKTFATKISGSGLGDCVIALAENKETLVKLTNNSIIKKNQLFPIKVSDKGLI